MLHYMFLMVLLLQYTSVYKCENSRSRIDIKHRYSPSHLKLHSPHQHLVSPINLLNPDKYEYFTINNQGNIIKRLMTSKEIQSIVAGNNIKQNVFDRLESPHGIITNIVSSIKNVLNTELLSKNQENQNADNNMNGNIADVTTYETTDKINEYVPAVLSFEISSPDEDEINATDLEHLATNCRDCGSTQNAVPNTTQLKPTQSTTESTTNLQHERVTQKIPTSTNLKVNMDKPTETQKISTPSPIPTQHTQTQSTTESVTKPPQERVTQKIPTSTNLNNNMDKLIEPTTERRPPQDLNDKTTQYNPTTVTSSNKQSYVEVTENTPTLLDNSSTLSILMLIRNLTKSTEKVAESTPQLLTEIVTEKITVHDASILQEETVKKTNRTESTTEYVSGNTPMLLEENKEDADFTISTTTENMIENTPMLLDNQDATNYFTISTERVQQNIPTLPTTVDTKTESTNQPSISTEREIENTPTLLDQYANENDQFTVSTEKVIEVTPQLLDEYSTEAMLELSNNFTESIEKAVESTSHRTEDITTETTYQSTESSTYQNDEKLLMSFILTNSLNDQVKEQVPIHINEEVISTESIQPSLPTANDDLLMSFMLTNNLTESSKPLQPDVQNDDKIIIFTLPSTFADTNIYEATTILNEEPATQSSTETIITTINDETASQYVTKNDYTKLTTYENLLDPTTWIQESSTEKILQDFNSNSDYTKTTLNDHSESFGIFAQSTNKPETTTFSVPQTTNPSKAQEQEESTTLPVDTQNAFYMILELLKDDNINNESSVQQYGQENSITESAQVTEEEDDEGYDENEGSYSSESFESTTAHAITDDPTNSNEITTEAPYSELPELLTTIMLNEKYHSNLVNTWNKFKPIVTTLQPTTMKTSPTTTTTTRSTSTTRPSIYKTTTMSSISKTTPSTTVSTTNQQKVIPSKAKPIQALFEQQPTSNEFVSLAEMILRQANPTPYENSAENVNVDNLLDLLAVDKKNMSSYVGETATVASVLKPVKKPQPIENAEPSEHDVLQSFLSITNELKQGMQAISPEDAANRITNDLFQKLGESEARRNITYGDQLITSDILTTQLDDFPEEFSEETDEEESNEMNDFFKLCNRIGMDMYRSITSAQDFEQTKSFAFSPFSAISMLSMLHLGARGKTADQINRLIGLDEMTSFNPHVTFRTISQSIEEENSNSYFVRMLFSDEGLGKLQNFFKTKVTQLYSGYAEEISFDDKNTITNRVNILVNNSTQGAQSQFLEDLQVRAAPPLCLISANSFELGCPTNDEKPDIFFHTIDANGKRKLVDLIADVYSGSFLFGYNTEMDVTAASIFSEAREISTIILMPGQQGGSIDRNSLQDLEKRIFTNNFPAKLSSIEAKLRPQISSVLHIPHLNQKSFVNVSKQLQQLGLGDLFQNDSANLKGIQDTTAAPIHMSEFLQINQVSLCDASGRVKMSEINSSFMDAKGNLRKHYQNAQKDLGANIFKLDKPFLYIIRHNPSQLILYVGRFNPVD